MLCHKWHEGHFLLVEVSGCLHRLRHVRATSAWACTPGQSHHQPRQSRRLWNKILLQHFSQIPGKKLTLSVTAELCCDASGSQMMSPRQCRSPGYNMQDQRVTRFGTVVAFATYESMLRWQYGNSTTKHSCLIGLEGFWNTI